MANKKRVFISYDYESDKHYKNLLLAWDANKQFDFYISDYSADVSINSTDATAIKSTISRYINQGTVFLVIVGKNTSKSSWVKWEIKKAIELGKKIVAVKTDRANTTPDELFGVGASWALSFTQDAITKALDNA
jgi:hypothetical protein